MGNNVNFVKWKWNHFVIGNGSGQLGCYVLCLQKYYLECTLD